MKLFFCIFSSFLSRKLSPVLLTCLLLGTGLLSAQGQATLWGTTPTGGFSGAGVIYSIHPDGSGMTVRYNFLSDGIDGNNPSCGLTAVGTALYGGTAAGGINSSGTLFSIDTISGIYTKLHDFTGADGANPIGNLTEYNGLLYGLTNYGGANGLGNVFSYDPVSGTYTDLLDLDNTVGGNPSTGFTLVNGQLYFPTASGGNTGSGTIAVYNPAAGNCVDLYDLNFNVSYNLVFYKNAFYGLNSSGGNASSGQIWSFDPVIRKFTDVYDFPFQSSGGYNPISLVLYNHLLYGTTISGGSGPSASGGTIFSFDPVHYKYAHLFDFDNNYASSRGNFAVGIPLAWNGALIGTTTYGGATFSGTNQGDGVIYSFDLSSGVYTKLQDFAGNNGMNPGSLPLVAAGPAKTGNTPQTITFPDTTKTYGDANFYLAASSSSGLPITYSTSDYTVGTLIGNGVHIAGAGVCTITAAQPGDDNYAPAAPVSMTLTVKKAPLLITADNQIAYRNQPVPPLTIHYSGFVNNEDSSYLSALPVISSLVDAATPQGAYPITIGGAASNNYSITYQQGTFYVYGLQQFLTVTDTIATYGDPDFAVATASSGMPVIYSVVDPSIATPSSTLGKLHITGGGATVVVVMQAGNTTFAPVTDSVSVTIHKAPLTVTADNHSIIYGQPVPLFSVTYNGFVKGENASSLGTAPLVTSSAASGHIYPGAYLLEATGAVSQNYSFSYINGLLTVTLPSDSLNAYCSSPGMLAVNILSTAIQKVQLVLYSLAGQRMLNSELSLQKGFNSFSFPVNNLSAGIYIIRVDAPAMHLNQKLKIK